MSTKDNLPDDGDHSVTGEVVYSEPPAVAPASLTTNPKDLVGVLKPSLHLVPPSAIIYLSQGFEDGAVKYGPYNWRTHPVRSTVYVSAALRHILAYFDGEEFASDSKRHHLAHALSCLAIIVDAKETGNLVDDRPSPGNTGELLKRLTKGQGAE